PALMNLSGLALSRNRLAPIAPAPQTTTKTASQTTNVVLTRFFFLGMSLSRTEFISGRTRARRARISYGSFHSLFRRDGTARGGKLAALHGIPIGQAMLDLGQRVGQKFVGHLARRLVV